MTTLANYSKWCLTALLICGVASAQNVPSYAELAANQAKLVEWMAANESGAKLYAESEPSDDVQKTQLALVVEGVDLESASTILAGPDAWCELMILHLNVKACVYGGSGDDQWIELYMGKKSYQRPDQAEDMRLNFSSGVNDDGVSWVELSADKGPYGTSEYYVGLYAIKAENGSYVQIASSQKVGRTAMSAMNMYFKTVARNKVGFSTVGTERNGEPKYSTGSQAALERNVARYLIAVNLYLPTHNVTGMQGLQMRAAPWFDETEKYPRQLHEVDRDDYLENKEKEYQNQLQLQAEISKR